MVISESNGGVLCTHIDESSPRDNRMRSRYVFVCGGIDGLQIVIKTQYVHHRPSENTSEMAFSSFGSLVVDVPQRRHRVCVLLWRLPKDEVPFALVDISLFKTNCL